MFLQTLLKKHETFCFRDGRFGSYHRIRLLCLQDSGRLPHAFPPPQGSVAPNDCHFQLDVLALCDGSSPHSTISRIFSDSASTSTTATTLRVGLARLLSHLCVVSFKGDCVAIFFSSFCERATDAGRTLFFCFWSSSLSLLFCRCLCSRGRRENSKRRPPQFETDFYLLPPQYRFCTL